MNAPFSRSNALIATMVVGHYFLLAEYVFAMWSLFDPTPITLTLMVACAVLAWCVYPSDVEIDSLLRHQNIVAIIMAVTLICLSASVFLLATYPNRLMLAVTSTAGVFTAFIYGNCRDYLNWRKASAPSNVFQLPVPVTAEPDQFMEVDKAA